MRIVGGKPVYGNLCRSPRHAILAGMRKDETTIEAVCAAFGIGMPVAAERVQAGYLNRDEAVTLADGRRLFLQGSRHRDPRVVAAEHAVIHHAAARGIPTPLPLATRDSRSVVVVDGTPWSAYPFIAGERLTGPETAPMLGRLLAAAHRALVSCPTAGLTFAEGPLDWSTAATLAEMAAIEGHIAAREAAGTVDAFDAFTRTAFATLRDVLRDAPPPDTFAWLPRQVIHGDCYPPNILCDPPGTPVALLDWEFATVRPRVWDVARAIAFTFLGVHGDPADVAAARACVAAYREVAPLPDDELAAGIALYLWRTAHNLAKYHWHDERGPQPTDALAPGDLALIRWLHRHGNALARALAGGPNPPPPFPTREGGAEGI
jgi:Ser/Thr protein kinase RdoA (MazF antagonist)